MEKSKQYWIDRSAQRMELAHRNALEVTAEVSQAYDKAIEQINADMDRILINFSKRQGMDKDKAIELLNEYVTKGEIKGIRKRMESLPDGPMKTELINKINAQAYKARMTREQALKANLRTECTKIAQTEMRASNKFYVQEIKDTYYRNMFDYCQGIGMQINFARIPTKTIEEILSTNWSGKHFSERIWGNSKVFGSKLEELLLKQIMTGKNSRETARELREYANVGKFASERLLRTETTYVSTMADVKAMEERGTKQLEFVATLDSRTSPQCQEHDGNIINVEDAEPGVNVPPLHCFCRSTVISIGELQHKVRFARDSKGKTINVPSSMKYREWYEKYIAPAQGGK